MKKNNDKPLNIQGMMRLWFVTAVRCIAMSGLFVAVTAGAQSDDDDDLLLMTVPLIAAKLRDGQSSGAPPTPSLTAIESALLNAHNQARASARFCGSVERSAVPALRWDTRLAEAARVHTVDMNNTGVLSHAGSDGSTVGSRVTKVRYIWSAVGENIANGHNTVTSVVNAFLNSRGHCNNIMSGNYRDMGAARIGRFWTIVFARQS